MYAFKNRWIKSSSLLLAGFILANAAISPPAIAAEKNSELHYTVYLGGLYLGGIETEIEQGDSQYKIESAANTSQAFNWIVSWFASGETEGLIGLDKFFPRQHQHKSTWNQNVRVVTMDYGKSGSVRVEKTTTRDEGPDRYTPINPASLTNSIDPMTAILTVTNQLDEGKGCTMRLPIFDGHRRYDAILSDVPSRYFKPTRYSVFSGNAIGCKLEFDRIGGFPVNQQQGLDANSDQDVVVWAGAPIEGGLIVPVRMQLKTRFGNMELHLDRYREGPMQLVSRNSQ
ncbi:DUF3108 domain-containing protein [uncultured Sneathiella sp.]|jgi:hypothetical protein|uniref:DUF3108 domain-containing protein n=1 Tax=uncultured Sneathiella sp. TaxID=879315 RepID=UPI0030DCD8B0|tara:strand:- start:37205 stop:38059 length:855 start_codon:yes stop_codon:yes gene_type:complete